MDVDAVNLAFEMAITRAMSWHPSETGPSYEETRAQVRRELLAALPAQEWQDISTAVVAERKACAKLAGDTALAWDNTLGGRMIGEEVSKAILARGTLIAEERGTK